MSTPYSRQRLLTDLLFVGGIVAVSAGLAAFGMRASAAPEPVATAKPTVVVVTPTCQETPMPLPITSQRVRPPQQHNPAGAPMPQRRVEKYPLPGNMVAPAPQARQVRNMPGDSAVAPNR